MIFNLKKIKSKVKNKIKKSKKTKKYLSDILDNFLEKDIQNAILYFYLGRIIAFIGYQSRAELFYRATIAIDNKKWKYYFYLAKSLKTQKKWWQVVDTLQEAINLNNSIAELHYRLALAQVKMNNFSEAEASYAKAIELYKKHTDWMYFNYGHALQKSGKPEEAKKAFSHAITLDKNNNSLVLGIGIFYEKKAQWTLALEAYKTELKENSQNALLHYKVGLSYAKSYDWKAAKKSIEQAVSLDHSNAYWFYRLGFVCERAQLWEEAEFAYKNAIEKQEKYISNWYYRLGYVQIKQEKYKTACNNFYSMYEFSTTQTMDQEHNNPVLQYSKGHSIQELEHIVENDYTNLTALHALAKSYEEDSYEKSEQMYRELIKRSENFDANLYVALGNILAVQEKYKEASFVYLKQKVIQAPYGVPEKSFRKNKNFRQVATYIEYFEQNTILKNSIIYESFNGVGMSCNPYAMFLDIIEDKRFDDWKHIWVIDDFKKIPEKYRKLKNVFFVAKNTDLYLKYLCTCEYLINNSTFPPYFIRKPDQKYLNTWHGTPLKTLGTDIKDSPYQRANTARNFLHATHMITPNRHTTDVLINRYGVKGIFNGKVGETGYPRIDLTLNVTNDRKNELFEMMEIDQAKPIVLYAPTYRGLWNTPEIETNKMLSDLKAMESDKFQLIFRGHYFAEEKIKNLNLPIKLAPHSIDSCELLSIVDILISDYSSIFYDFLPTERPIIHYVHDYNEYSETRGMYFGIDELPGTICHTVNEVLDTLDNIILSPNKQLSPNYRQAKDKFSLFEDGQSAKRTIEFFFFDNFDDNYLGHKSLNKKSILFYSPFELTGITSSIINLVNHIDETKYNINIIVGRNSLVGQEDRIEKLNQLNPNINIIIRSGRMVNTVEEQWVRNKFGSYKTLENTEMQSIYKKAFEREFTRMFGYHKFDSIIDFNGYRPFWASLFAFGASKNKSIYLHNDMYKEHLIKFPYLEATFNLYKYFNKLISVSESVSESNITSLSKKYSIPKNLFQFCNNPINFTAYKALSSEILDSSEYESFMQDKRKKFINAARLSPEKGQTKLIDAFAKVLETHKDIVLYIIGTGPLFNMLQHKINVLGVEENIFLLGYQSNPYPYIKNSNCTILSSEHEGQGIVLLEALFFHVPCISTDIPGPRSVLSDGYGVLVKENTEAISKGIENFLGGKYNCKPFDSLKYNQDALDMFYEKVIN